MFKVLLESRAPHTRGIGSTLTSALLHGAIVAASVALTLPGRGSAKTPSPLPPPRAVVAYVVPSAPKAPAAHPRPAKTNVDPHGLPSVPTIAVPTIVPTELPPIEVGPGVPPDQIRIEGPASRVGELTPASEVPPLGGAGSAIDVAAVDRPPRVLGHAVVPRYPAQLRDAGVQGRVVAQFIVDTLGRAEMDGLQLLDTPHALFAESVRSALARYRFTPGEAGGHKVRTRVQIPFEFILTK